jgi:LuxR family maltose regulon positive regulatory protein
MPEMNQSFSILRTKLHRPPLPADFVPRPELHDYLHRYLNRPLTIISAPPGYGKSTLISSWLESCEHPGAWVSLDKDDSDLVKFLSYILEAIKTIIPEFGNNTSALLNASELAPRSILGASLSNDLAKLDEKVILVLDDYHHVHNSEIHELVAELLRHPPNKIHLILITRRDPHLPLTSIRARNQMTEIRARDLSFSVQETMTLFSKILEKEVDKSTASLLLEKTEGWVTALRLAALSLRQQDNLEKFIDRVKSGNRYTMDYLMSEILSQLEPQIKNFLIKTSILDKLAGPICDYVVKLNEPVCDGQAYLEWLQKVNLFIIPLDEKKEWYRYHHLFKELLKRELKKAYKEKEISTLHARAGRWFSKNDFYEESIYHFIKAGDMASAIQRFKTGRRHLMNNVQWQKLEHVLNLLPEIETENDPELLLSKCWVLIYQGKAFEAFDMISSVEQLLQNGSIENGNAQNLLGELQVLKAWKEYNLDYNFEQAFEDSESAIKNLFPENLYPQGIAWIFWGGSLQALGRYEDALTGIYNKLAGSTDSLLSSSLLLILNYIYWLEGDLSNLKKSAEHQGRIGQNQENLEGITNSQYFLGIVYYHQDKLDLAIEILEQAYANRFHTIGVHNINISCALALSYQETGKTEKALDVLDQISEFALTKGNPYFTLIRKALQAEIDWLQGNEADAVRWAEKTSTVPLVPFTNFLIVHIVLLKILIHQNSLESHRRAAVLLEELESYLVGSHNQRFLIEIYALKALFHWLQGHQEQAIASLEESILIAEPGGFLRPFLDMGPQMAVLLQELVKNNIMVGYAGKLLTAFREKSVQQTSDLVKTDFAGLVDKISKREIEILSLLAKRMSNKEISEELYISYETVKRHTKNIYQKLNVSTRQEAVDKATALGVLRSSQ